MQDREAKVFGALVRDIIREEVATGQQRTNEQLDDVNRQLARLRRANRGRTAIARNTANELLRMNARLRRIELARYWPAAAILFSSVAALVWALN